MLITNDTGTMHLAAGLNVPVLAIFLATAQAWDTAPYQDGVICLEPDLPDHPRPFDDPCPANCACRTAILPETVFALAKGHLETGNWNYTPNTTAKARVWLTRRAPTTVDPEAFLDLESLSGHEFEQRTFWLRLQRYFLRAHLDNNLAQIAPGLPENLATGLKNMSPDFLNSLSEELSQSGALLHLFSEQGLALSVNPLPILKNRFMSTWQRLQTLWDNSDYFNVLGLLWLAQTQEQGDELGRVLELAKRYTQLCELWKAALFPK